MPKSARPWPGIRLILLLPCCVLWLYAVGAEAQQQSPGFVAPPRTIADITAMLDREKPDPQVVAQLHADANAEPRPGLGNEDLAIFYFNRCRAHSILGDFAHAIADCDTALKRGEWSLLPNGKLNIILAGSAREYQRAGEFNKALAIYKRMLRPITKSGREWNFLANHNIALLYIRLGDLKQAEIYVRRNDELIVAAQSWPGVTDYHRAGWQSQVEIGHAELLAARGQFREAEVVYRRAEAYEREALDLAVKDSIDIYPELKLEGIDSLMAAQARMKSQQGRVAEGEADARRALLGRLKAKGKYNIDTARYLGFLAIILVEQGRFVEAEHLIRSQLEIYKTLDLPGDFQHVAQALNRLASSLTLQGRWDEAAKVYNDLDEATAGWPVARKQQMFGADRVYTLYATSNLPAGIATAQRLVAHRSSRYGDQNWETAMARGLLAIGLARAGREADARREFNVAIPILASTSHDTDVDDALSVAASNQRLELVIEGYMALLGRSADPLAAEESFHFADIVRNRSVRKAVAASSARAVIGDPALAELARKAQDLDKQIVARLDALNNVLALPPEQRDEAGLKALQGDIDALQRQRDSSRRDLTNRFPHYASLVEPQAPSVDDIRKVLHEDEVFISIYFGPNASFVWAVPKDRPVAFAVISAGAGKIQSKVTHLREALDREVDDPKDIPPFDVDVAYELFTEILKPVEQAWRPAKSLIVATNGALGMLPLGLLPTEPILAVGKAGSIPFEGYRDVAWLARTHAVTLIPSAASLRTLRQLPAGPADRQMFIGFGDPYFSKEQAADSQHRSDRVAVDTSGGSRGAPMRRRSTVVTQNVDRAELAQLPRLPDTAEELTSVALALSTDPAKVLHLGIDANEKTVKEADLLRYRIIEFATHALRAGDLDGLTEPALALTAPEVAGIDGDGLLTMGKVLALKLNADWVVLSACNTAAGAGAGAEALSGLGRAFFYAGARTLLVTNWPVVSSAARDLVTDLFLRQAHDPNLTRTEALRQAMVALMDGPGFTDANGKTLYSYAHPLFWAPYSIIGDGGSTRP